MQSGLPVSIVIHGLIIAWGVIALPSASPVDATNLEQIPVDYVEIDDVTQLTRGLQTAALVEDVPPPPAPVAEPPPLPKPAPPPPPEPPPPEPEPEPLPLPTPPPPAPEPPPPPPAPSPEAIAPPPPEDVVPPRPMTNVPMPRQRPERRQQVAEVPEANPEEPKDTFDVDQLTAMLDTQPTDSTPPVAEQEPTVGAPDAPSNVRMTATEFDLLRSRLAQCWNPPMSWVDPAEVRVVLVFSLNVDGSLNGMPQVVEAPQGQFSRQAPESAIRAVRQCAPYNLPADKYDAWREVKVTFDPRDMGRI